MGSPCRAFSERFGAEIQVNPVLACDNDPECQEHIKAMGETRILFNDVEDVAKGSGVNLLTGKQEKLPEIDLLAAGTSCVNLSSENLGSLGKYVCICTSSFHVSRKCMKM